LAKKIVSLTTDFGLKDPYVAEMKAVILGICPDAVFVDVSHEIEKFNIRMAAYVIASAAPYFPKGAIHVVVVDPGVGSERKAVVVETKAGFLVGPDNGVLALAAEKQTVVGVREISNSEFMLSQVSSTFHGRDVFAPAAAYLANGVRLADFGAEIQELTKPAFAKAKYSESVLKGEVLHIDCFGNIITNINAEELKKIKIQDSLSVEIGKHKTKLKLAKTYAETKQKETMILLGSQGYVEIAVNKGSAAEKFKTKIGDKIQLSKL
jgi:S-adenosylmethionine hydrolase